MNRHSCTADAKLGAANLTILERSRERGSSKARKRSRLSGLNPRPAVYETAALPLSYLGKGREPLVSRHSRASRKFGISASTVRSLGSRGAAALTPPPPWDARRDLRRRHARQRHDRVLRVHAEVRREHAGVHDVQRLGLVRLKVEAHGARPRVRPHARGAEQVRATNGTRAGRATTPRAASSPGRATSSLTAAPNDARPHLARARVEEQCRSSSSAFSSSACPRRRREASHGSRPSHCVSTVPSAFMRMFATQTADVRERLPAARDSSAPRNGTRAAASSGGMPMSRA